MTASRKKAINCFSLWKGLYDVKFADEWTEPRKELCQLSLPDCSLAVLPNREHCPLQRSPNIDFWEDKGIFSGKHLIIQHKTENCTLKMAPLFTQNYEFCAGLKWFGFRQAHRTRQEIRKQTLWEQEIIQRDQFTYAARVLGFIGWFEGVFSSRDVSSNHSPLSPSPSMRSQVSKLKVLSEFEEF